MAEMAGAGLIPWRKAERRFAARSLAPEVPAKMTIERAKEILAELHAPDPDFDPMSTEFHQYRFTQAEVDAAGELVGPLSQYAADQRRIESEEWITRNCDEPQSGGSR